MRKLIELHLGAVPVPVAPDPQADPRFYDFAARIARHELLRRAVIALADDEERAKFEKTLKRAEEIR